MAMQPYMMLIGNAIVPVTPEKITTKYKGKNKTVELVDGSIINKLNPPGLATYKFTLLLPKNTNLPFANKLTNPNDLNGEKVEHLTQDHYLRYFYDIFRNNKVVLFTIWRTAIGGRRDMGTEEGIDVSGNGIITSKNVTIESYSVEENAENGLDMELDIELQEYISYGTQKFKFVEDTETGTKTAATEATRKTDNKEVPATYTVKKGDNLSLICKKELGDVNKWKDIAKLNNLENANKIYPGQVLKLK